MTLRFHLSEPADRDLLGQRWRALEARAAPVFFRGWTWVGCVGERFARPVLLEGWRDGVLVALGLFNRQARGPLPARLWLGETGDAALDRVFVEHNGLLLDRAAADEVLPAALRHLGRAGGHVVLGGIDGAHLAAAAASGARLHRRARDGAAPWLDLAEVRAAPGGHLDLLSANTRQQLRRSLRRYGQAGPLSVRRAADPAEAEGFLEALIALHQRSWLRRGQPGAFADPAFARFHHSLLAAGFPRGEIDLLRVAAGPEAFGYLYNFRYGGRVSNYQSGFDYDAANPAQKPGLTSHHLAITHYAAAGLDAYDFLAGDQRYKTSLANHSAPLHWVEMMPRYSPVALMHALRGWVRGEEAAGT